MEVLMQRIDKRCGLVALLASILFALTGVTAGASAPAKAPPPSPIKGLLGQHAGGDVLARGAIQVELDVRILLRPGRLHRPDDERAQRRVDVDLAFLRREAVQPCLAGGQRLTFQALDE